MDWNGSLALVLFGLTVVWFYLRRRWRHNVSSAGYSQVDSLEAVAPSLKALMHRLPEHFGSAALFVLALAVLDIRLPLELDAPPPTSEPEQAAPQELTLPTEGIAAYLVLDQSGSMRRPVNLVDDEGRVRQLTRLQLLKEVTRDFVQGNTALGLNGRPNDLLGLVTFARVAQVRAPLTLDHASLVQQLDALETVERPDRDGTALGYALFKTANLIAATRYYAQELVQEGEPSYDIQSSIIILVTDGFHEPNPMDREHPLRSMTLDAAANYAVEKDVRVYVVNIEPAVGRPEFTAQRAQLESVAERTGGAFFLMQSRSPLHEIYAEIDRLERSQLPIKQQVSVEDLVPGDEERSVEWSPIFRPLLILVLCLLITSVIGETVLLRRAP